MTDQVRYRGFFGRVKANLLLERGLKHGADCYGVHLSPSISTEVRRLVREHLNKPRIPQTEEEVFFSLVVYGLPSLDPETLLWLYQDVEASAGMNRISEEVRAHFMSAIADLGPEQRREINKWVAWRKGRDAVGRVD